MRLFLSVIAFASMVCCGGAVWGARQTQETLPALKIGDAAPAIKLGAVLEGGTARSANIEELKGKILVIEFWATWCAPCVAAIPHLNEMVEKTRDSRIQFISVTDENLETARKFVAEHPIKGWVVSDQSASGAYRVTGIPLTFIVDAQGRIAGVTVPKEITEERLSRLAKGESVDFPARKPGISKPGEDLDGGGGGLPPVFRIEIRPAGEGAEDESSMSGPTDGKFTAVAMEWPYLINAIYEIATDRIVHAELLPSKPYSMTITMPPGRGDLFRPMAEEAIEASLGIRAVYAEQKMDTLDLKQIPGASSAWKPSVEKNGYMSLSAGRARARAMSMQVLCDFLESEFKMPVFDETNLKAAYDFEMRFAVAKPDTVKEALKGLGLELVPGRRKVKVLVLERRQ